MEVHFFFNLFFHAILFWPKSYCISTMIKILNLPWKKNQKNRAKMKENGNFKLFLLMA